MDHNLINMLLWYGGIGSAIIGLIIMILSIRGKGETPPDTTRENASQKQFLLFCWIVFIALAVIMTIIIGFMPGKKGIRGILASGVMGFFIPVFLASMDSLGLRKLKEKAEGSLFLFSSLPMGGIGLSLLYAGFVTVFYGIRAVNLWVAFIIGAALGLYLLRIAANQVQFSRYLSVATKVESVMYIVMAVLISTIMAGYHFTTHLSKVYVPLLLLMAVYIITLICCAPCSYKKNIKTMNIIPAQSAIFLILFLGVVVFIINKFNVKVDYSYPIICGAVTSALFIILLHNSSSSVKGVDLSTGALAALLLIGGLWFSYKWALGFGMTLYSVGLLSIAAIIVPHRSFETRIISKERLEAIIKPVASQEGEPFQPDKKDTLLQGETEEIKEGNKDEDEQEKTEAKNNPGVHDADVDSVMTWAKLFNRGICLAGLVTIIIGLFRILMQSTNLLTLGIDISFGDVMIALLLGVLLPLVFEGFNLAGPNIFFKDKYDGLSKGILRYFSAIVILAISIAAVGLLFKLDGLGAFIVGMSITSLIGVFAFFSQKNDMGIYRAANSSLWIAGAATALFLTKFHDLPDKMTRANKQQIVVFIMVLVMIAYLVSYLFNKKRKAA
ncbi:MAG: hypothetical protein K8T10_11790 [Candidatus Eremiobacteraeota bacterium]|nr:hypothetical protein [Candidatus Eremiobacteraeota bacterium]